VVFKVDYTVEAIGNREFGSVFLGQENVALTVISSGWAKVGMQRNSWLPCIPV
jgi:staphylococcal nuclease domain-containing protein 1